MIMAAPMSGDLDLVEIIVTKFIEAGRNITGDTIMMMVIKGEMRF